jgi:antitoxin HigA-1
MRKIRLAHPGELLLEEFIKPNKLSIYRVAKDAGIARPTLQSVVSGQRGFSAETALRLGLYFGIDAQFWLNLQSEYDLRIAQERTTDLQKEVHPLNRAA